MFHIHGDFYLGLYILNRPGPTIIADVSIRTIVWKKANLKHLRIIGNECFAHILKQNKRKMDNKSIKRILVGYDFGGYRIWSKGIRVIRSRDTIFYKNPLVPKS